jgi:type I restriction enzyme S subunit
MAVPPPRIATGKIPVTRFPGFEADPAWREDSLGELVSPLAPPKKIQSESYLTEGEFPIIDQSRSYIAGWTNDESAAVRASEPLIVFGDHTCVVKLVNRPFAQGADGIRILAARAAVDVSFLYQSILSNPLDSEGYKRHFSALKQLQIFFPESKAEQTRISQCLAFIDELIATQARRIEALEAHKKGLLQQLFPPPGATVPMLRFAEFRDAPHWEDRPLGNVANIVTGNTPSTADSSNYDGDSLFVSPADMGEGRYVAATKTTLSESGFEAARRVPANSILFVCIGSTIGKIAQNALECATNQQINSVIPFAGYSNDFIYSALEHRREGIAATAGNHAVPILNKSDFSSALVSFPSRAEQEKIAACMSSLDAHRQSLSRKLDALEGHKKGLMQLLFPAAGQT